MRPINEYLVIMIQILLSIVTLGGILGREAGLPRGVFWVAMWALVIVTFILTHSQPKRIKLISLAILAITVSLIQIAAIPEPYQLGRDNFFESQYASIITETGIWDAEAGTGFAENYYGHNPGLHFIIGITSLVTGISTFILSKYLFFVFLRLLLVAFTYLIIDSLLGKKREEVTFLAILLFIGSAGMAFVGVSRRIIGAIFLLLTIYVMIRSIKEPKRAVWYILFGLFSPLIIIADHAVSYFFLMFIITYWIFSLFCNVMPFIKLDGKIPTPLFMMIFFATMLFVWEIYITQILIVEDIAYIGKILGTISTGFGATAATSSGPTVPSIYYTWELLTIYAAQAIFLLMGGIGFLTAMVLGYKRHRQGYRATPLLMFMTFFSINGFIMYLFMSLFIATGTSEAGTVMLWFYGIPLTILIAMFLRGNIREYFPHKLYVPVVSLIIIILFTGSLLMGIYTPRLVNRIGFDDIVIGQDDRAKNEEAFLSAQWLDGFHEGKNGAILGDIITYELYSGLYQFDVTSYPDNVETLYRGEEKDLAFMVVKDFTFGNYRHVLHKAPLDYIVLNDHYFQYPNDAFIGPLRDSTVVRYDRSSSLDRIYDNGQMSIFAVDRG